jgi:hypothetical protein
MLILIILFILFESEAKKMDHAIQLPALLKAENLRFHVEDNDEYVELYMHIANLLQGNHEWAVWHPEEVNKMKKNAWNHRYIIGNPQGRFGAQSGYINGDLFMNGMNIDVERFRVRVIKRVVVELRAAGYNVSYTLSDAPGFPKRPQWVPSPPLPNAFTLSQLNAMNMDPKQKGLLLKATSSNESPWGEEQTITYEQIGVLNLTPELKKHLLQQLSSISGPPQTPPPIVDVELDERPTNIKITL